MSLINKRARPRRSPRKGLVPVEGKSVPQMYLSRVKSNPNNLFDPDHTDNHHRGRIKWLISTCLAALVGLAALGVALYGSSNMEDGSGMVASIKRASLAALKPFQPKAMRNHQVQAAFGKTDRLPSTSLGLLTRHIIHDSVVQKRGTREFIAIKPYARIVTRLSTTPPSEPTTIPRFNPFKLYANLKPVSDNKKTKLFNSVDFEKPSHHVQIKVVDLPQGILKVEDNQQLNENDVRKIVRDDYQDETFQIRATIHPEGDAALISYGNGLSPRLENTPIKTPIYTTTLIKNIIIPDEDTIESLENHIISIGRKDNLMSILKSAKVSNWQAGAVSEAMQPIYPANNVQSGQKFHLMLTPSLINSEEKDLVRISIYESGAHLVSVARNAAGEFVASNHGAHTALLEKLKSQDRPQRATLYASIFQSALAQNIDPKQIIKILRIHAYDSDFKQRVAPGDGYEFFFDIEGKDQPEEGELGELLFTALTTGGVQRKFYRYRTPDGEVDYYDHNGNNSKKFLMRKPVRGGGARFTSGYGMRRHPLLHRLKMHRGVDWAARPGTPILAAGNGTVEEAQRRSGYGNYVRIRHANGYKTSYAHMRRFAPGVRPGVNVTQGQVIGYVGSTGLSSGPHLHFEVLVNNGHVNPMRIHVPRGRQLKGKNLADFQKERARIDRLMRRVPVKTQVANSDL